MQKISIDIACLSIIRRWLDIQPNGLQQYLQLKIASLDAWMRLFINYSKDQQCRFVCKGLLLVMPSSWSAFLREIEYRIFTANQGSDIPQEKPLQCVLESLLCLVQDTQVILPLGRDPACLAMLKSWPDKLREETKYHLILAHLYDPIASSIEQHLGL